MRLAASLGVDFPSLASQAPKRDVRFANCNAPAFAPSKGAVLRLDDPAIELGVQTAECGIKKHANRDLTLFRTPHSQLHTGNWWPARVTRPVLRIKSPSHHFNACRPELVLAAGLAPALSGRPIHTEPEPEPARRNLTYQPAPGLARAGRNKVDLANVERNLFRLELLGTE